MSKEDDIKFLKIQTCVLKVNIHCDGCKQKVKKLLQKIEGVYTTNIDADNGKVTISGNFDPANVIKKLRKAGKHAELWASSKGGNKDGGNQINKQFQNMHIDPSKGQKDSKPQKGGNEQKGLLPQITPQQLQQMKAIKDMKLPQFKDLKAPPKDPKSVKFNLPEDDEFSDEFDDYDDELDDDFDDDEFDDEHEELMKAQMLKDMKMKGMNGHGPIPGYPPMNGHGIGGQGQIHSANDKKGGGGGGGGFLGGNGNKNMPAPAKGATPESKNGNAGKKNGGNQVANQSQNHGGGGKVGSGNNKNTPNGGGGNVNVQGGGKKGGNGGGGGGGKDMNHGGFHELDLRSGGASAGQMAQMAKMGQMGQMPKMNQMGQMGQMGQMPKMNQMGQTGNGSMQHPHGNMQAVQGLPMNPGVYYPGAGPEAMANNPYQQQYMAAMMQQQRQNGGADRFQPMAYARPPPAVAYAPPPAYMQYPPYPQAGPEFTHYFSDENTNSCSVM